jgi:Holliday junction resolvase RusA-like endonuclease
VPDRLAFSVPGAPRGKARPRAQARLIWQGPKPIATVHIHSDDKSTAAEREILMCFRHRFPRHRPFVKAVMVRFTAVFEPPASWPKYLKEAAAGGQLYHTQKPDKDNIEKLIVDALNGFAWADDAQVQGGGVKRWGSPARLDIVLESLESPDLPPTPGQRAAEQRLSANGPGQRPAGRAAKSPKADKRTPLQRAIDDAIARDRR